MSREILQPPDNTSKTPQPQGDKGCCCIDCNGLWDKVKEFLKDNYTTPIFWIGVVWLLMVIVSGAYLFMALVGMIPYDDVNVKNYVIEVNSQILNALFTVAAIYNQPQRAFNVILLLGGEYTKLKESYSWACPEKNTELWILLVILNFNCIFQYPMAISMWAYIPMYTERPAWSVAVFLVLSFSCAIIGGVLEGVFGKDSESDDNSLQKQQKKYGEWVITDLTKTDQPL